MSDLLAIQNAPNATPDGQSQQASAQTQEGTDGQTPDGQSAQKDNIKELQRLVSAKDTEAKRALAEVQRTSAHMQQLQQRLAAMEDATAPDDYSRLELQLKRAQESAQQYYYAWQNATAAQETERQRLESLRDIADDFGVSVKDLEDATDYKSAVKLAVKAQLEKDKRKQVDDNDKRDRNMPDLGTGASSSAGAKADAEWAELVRTRDTTGQMRWLRTYGGKR